jgi:hypothetical protein
MIALGVPLIHNWRAAYIISMRCPVQTSHTNLAATTAICRIHAQSSPQELADRVLQRWTEDSAAAFASQFPFREGQEIHSNAAKAKLERTKGLSSVVHADQTTGAASALGRAADRQLGRRHSYGMGFSGIYEALADEGRWRLGTSDSAR